ncbi:MAG: HEAT repeat domain-containing protein [Gemmataceae bacterium]|nr:HEAT repeat domain-containing protein [Gemmataceae bacterium]MCS7270735.1 HEAT repeat domain-containing protein [Gemmataceae bacterium]MDW8243345.1 HEAT repeat domain-containing protein [Thermogemmata sp.]
MVKPVNGAWTVTGGWARTVGSAALLLAVAVGMSNKTVGQQEPEYQGKKASAWLEILANDSSARKRALAVEAAVRLWVEHQHTEALAGVVRAVRLDNSAAVRATAARALAGLPERDIRACARELAEALSGEKDSRVRRELAGVMARHEEVARGAVTALIGLLQDKESATRAAAAEALAVAGNAAQAAAPELVALLRDADPLVRRAAIRALGRIQPAGAAAVADTLASMLNQEKDQELRIEIITSLGLLSEKTPAVVHTLAQLLQQNDGELRLRSLRVLTSFGPAARAALPEVLRVAQKDPLPRVRQEAVHAYAAILSTDLPTQLSTLLDLLQDADFGVRLAVLEEIAALGPTLRNNADALRAIRLRLSDPHVKVREAAAAALKRIEQKPKEPGKQQQ